MAIKISVSTTNPITVASLRLIIGSIFLFTYYKFRGLKENLSVKILLFIFLIGVIGNFIPFSLISWSEQFIQSNTAGLLLSVAPIFTLFLSYFFIKGDKFFLRTFISMLVGLLGVIFIFGFDTLIHISLKQSEYFFPKLAIIIAALGYVVSAILAYNIKHISTITLTTFVTISAALISLPFMIVAEFTNPSNTKINITPRSPTNIDINVLRKNLSPLMKKYERNKVKIGATDNKSPAVLD
jgi:drug/metabolite transporter (DMT)-like permease